MIVHLSAEAERDLEAIGDHIAKDSPARALSFLRELRAKCFVHAAISEPADDSVCLEIAVGLADMPERFPLMPRYEASGVRHRVHGNYLIFYRVEADRVVIPHVLHGARDYGEIFSGE